MRRLTYVYESMMVGDSFGQLVLDYAAALARNETSEPLHFRAVNDEGEVDAAFLLGLASQIVVIATDSVLPEPDNTAAEERMRARIRELSHPVPHPVESTGHPPIAED